MTSAGSIRGSIRISAKQAIAEYAALRLANATTRTALLSASAAFVKVGVGALAAAAPIALLFKSAISAAATFQKKMDYFGAVTNATQAEMDAVAKKAMEMARTTVYSADQMADAFVEFGKAGFSTKAILNGVAEATVNLAQAADISMAEAANIMASQLSTFKMGAKDAAHVSDVLAGAANASIIDITDLAYSLKYAGGIAASTGVSFDSLVAAISLLGKRGIRGSQAGTSLRMILVSLLGTTAGATKELKKLGIITKDGTNKFVDARGHIKSLAQDMEILRRAEAKMTDAEQLQTNKRIFNTRALSAVQILMRDGAKGFRKMEQEMGKVTAADVARKRLDNLAGDWTRFKNNLKTTLIQVGGPLQNFFRMIVQSLTKLVKWFGSLSETQQKFIIYGLGIVGLFLTFVGILSLFIGMVLRTIVVFKDLKMAFMLVRMFIMESLIPALETLFVTIATNPILLIIVAVVALVAVFIYCWKHFKGFRDFFKKAWEDIKGFFVGAWHIINRVFRDIVGAIEAFGRGFMRYLVDPVVKAWKAVVHAFAVAYKAVARAIKAILGFVKEHWKAIIAILLPGLGLTIDAIVTHWKAISGFFTKIWNFMWPYLKKWGPLALSVLMPFIGIPLLIWQHWSQIIGFLTRVWNTVWPFLKQWGPLALSVLLPFVGIPLLIWQHWSQIIGFLSRVWNSIIGPLKAFWNGVVNFFQMILTKIYQVFKALLTPIVRLIINIWHSISGPLESAATAVWNGIQSVIGKVFGVIAKVAKQIFNAFNSLYKDMLVVGKNIAIGIWNGIASMADWLWNKVSSFVSNIWNNVLDFFGIHSPSKKGQYVGEMIVLGMAQGIATHEHFLKSAVLNLAQHVGDALKNATDQLAQARADYVNNIRDVMLSIIGQASITNADIGAIVKTDATTGVTTTSYTAKSIAQAYRAKAYDVLRWADDIKKLKKMGLSPILLDQFIQTGIDSLPQVEALLKASKGQIKSINRSYAWITHGAYDAAKLDSKLMFKAGVDAAKGLVAGLKSERRALLAIARKMGKDMVRAVKDALGIKSPSTVMRDQVGRMMVLGLAQGISANKHRAVKAVLDVNRAMAAAHTSSLETSMSATYNRAGLAALQSAAMNNGFASGKGSRIGVNIENYNSHNPVPERDSDSLPRKIRQLNYIMPGPAR